MAKRFIDTDLFDDSWFMNLTLSGKVFWLYCITKCDHAGILELNTRLAQFQTGIKNIDTVIKELDNRLVRVNEQYIFIPKYIEFQYPGFPNSKVRQQASAVAILKKFNLFDNTLQTVTKELIDSYVNVTVNEDDNETVIEIEPIPAYEEFLEYAKSKKPDINESALKFKYEAWVENGWRDGNNNKVVNWKSKLLNTIPHLKDKPESKNLYPGYKDSSFD